MTSTEPNPIHIIMPAMNRSNTTQIKLITVAAIKDFKQYYTIIYTETGIIVLRSQLFNIRFVLPIYATPTIHHVWARSVKIRSAKFRTDINAPRAVKL